MIQAIFVIYKGVCLFSRQYGKSYQKTQLLSAFLTAINQLAIEISHKNLKKLVLDEEIFSFSMVNNILFVYAHDDIKDSELIKISNEFSSKFIECFSSEIKDWEGEVSCFEVFNDQADDIVSMKGKSTILEMEQFLQDKKIKRLIQKQERESDGKEILLEMEKFLKGKKQKK
jgi:hypothetical protein